MHLDADIDTFEFNTNVCEYRFGYSKSEYSQIVSGYGYFLLHNYA